MSLESAVCLSTPCKMPLNEVEGGKDAIEKPKRKEMTKTENEQGIEEGFWKGRIVFRKYSRN